MNFTCPTCGDPSLSQAPCRACVAENLVSQLSGMLVGLCIRMHRLAPHLTGHIRGLESIAWACSTQIHNQRLARDLHRVKVNSPAFSEGRYTGREIQRLISYVLPGGQFGIQTGYCVMGIRPLPAGYSFVSRVEELKVWPEYFNAIKSGSKAFEVRRNDRDFRQGVVLKLREWVPVQAFEGKAAQ